MGGHERLGWRGGGGGEGGQWRKGWEGSWWRTWTWWGKGKAGGRGGGGGAWGEKEKEKDCMSRGGGGSGRMGGGGGGGAGLSGRKAGMALFIIGLTVLVIAGNANLILKHPLLWMRKDAFEAVSVVRSSSVDAATAAARASGYPKAPRGGASSDLSAQVEPAALRIPILSPHPCDGFSIPPPPTDPKRTGPRPCPVCYLPQAMAIAQMPAEQRFVSPVLKQLHYVSDPVTAKPPWEGAPGSPFGGYPSLQDRADSFEVRESMRVHCGFVKGATPGVGTGYDIDEDDREAMYACKGVVVASAIFGNYDQLQQPKNISRKAEQSVCFFMFVDEETEASMDEYENFQTTKRVGMWRIVVVRNLPYTDARRNGKIPKLLLHRLFPNVRFSIWVDGKLELVQDPYRILERFLWRTNDTFAISQHYKRFDVFMEAEANKAAAKYDNKSIDAQVDFYRNEGLTPYTSAKLPITSDVPEGCVIIREHTPIANLMSCLWFNEVDRFTSRDQLSFGIVRDKFTANLPWRVNMFLDCERRNFVVQAYHRDLLEKVGALQKPKSEGTAAEEGSSVVVIDNPLSKPQMQTHATSKRARTSSRHRKEGQGRRPRGRILDGVSLSQYGS